MDPLCSSASLNQSLVSISALEALASHFNSDACDVRLLRLRLRFGSPRCVSTGVAFRLVVDLVDEMAQPPTTAIATALEASMDVHVELDSQDVGACELVSCCRVPSSSSSLQWRFDCVIASRSDASQGVRLRIYSSTREAPAAATASHALLKSFCVGSQWICTDASRSHILVLPVVSDKIQVVSSDKGDFQSAPATSSLCLREFVIPSAPIAAPLRIEEDYGEAMGSHIWDASIWLSLALIASSQAESQAQNSNASLLTMLELGAGCGLFAVVFARLASLKSQPFRIVLTEKGNSITRISQNLERNNINNGQEAVVREIMWGSETQGVVPDASPSLDVVFAADVLYHWSAHEALLATLEDLVASDSEAPVFIAHKHRGHATAQRLEGVLSHGIDSECGPNKAMSQESTCRWSQWHVERLARIANIDVLQLTRKKKA